MTRHRAVVPLMGGLIAAAMLLGGCSHGSARGTADGPSGAGQGAGSHLSDGSVSGARSAGMTSFSPGRSLTTRTGARAGAAGGGSVAGDGGAGDGAGDGAAAGDGPGDGAADRSVSASPGASMSVRGANETGAASGSATDDASSADGTPDSGAASASGTHRETSRRPAPQQTTSRKPPPASTTPAAKPKSPEVLTAAVLADINRHRKAAGAPPLKASSCANASAMIHAKAEARRHKMFHRSLAAIKQACKMAGGENVAFGYSSAAAVMKGWWGSTPHRKNLLDKRYVYTGVAVAYASDGTPYYTQVFYIPD